MERTKNYLNSKARYKMVVEIVTSRHIVQIWVWNIIKIYIVKGSNVWGLIYACLNMWVWRQIGIFKDSKGDINNN